jgi:hypothetical protein
MASTVAQAGMLYTQLSDEIRQDSSTIRDKRRARDAKEAEIIGCLGAAKSGQEIKTPDGRTLMLTYKHKKPSLAKKEFLLKGLETFWNSLTSIEHEMTGSVFAGRQLKYLQELQAAAEENIPVIKEKGPPKKKRKRGGDDDDDDDDDDGGGGGAETSLLLQLLGP